MSKNEKAKHSEKKQQKEEEEAQGHKEILDAVSGLHDISNEQPAKHRKKKTVNKK